MTLGSSVAGCSLAGSLITPSVMASVGAIKFTSTNACSEGADPIGPWTVDSTCSEGQVVGRRAVGAGHVNLYQHALNDPGVFGSWLLPSWQSDNSICNGSAGANRTCSSWVIALVLLPTCSEGADPIGPWAVDFMCIEGQVVGRRAVRAGPSVWGTCSLCFHQHDYSGGLPMTLRCLAAGCSLAGSLIHVTPSIMAPLVLTGCAEWGY